MSSDSFSKTITVAALLCIVCSILVSGAAISLRDIQERNKVIETKKNILAAAGLLDHEGGIEVLFDKYIKSKLVTVATGEYVEGLDALTYNQKKASRDPAQSVAIPPKKDIAKIRRTAKIAKIYLVQSEGQIQTVILPIKGKGLWSTLYGFLALEADVNTVKGLTFYEHAETPGLGGEVDNPLWKNQWPGKKIFDAAFMPAVEVLKGKVNKSSEKAIHQVDGLSGATLTTRGVSELIRFWIGTEGFGPYLEKIRGGQNG